MSDIIISVSAGFGLVVSGIGFLLLPFYMGKPKTGKYDATTFFMILAQLAAFICLSGRIWGWW